MEITHENILRAKADCIEHQKYIAETDRRNRHDGDYLGEIPRTFKEVCGYEIQLEPFDLIGERR